MALDRNGQWEIDGVLLGPGTPFGITSVSGLGVPDPKTSDFDRSGVGDYAGNEDVGPRDIQFTIDADLDALDSAEGEAAVEALSAVWVASDSDVVARYMRWGRIRRFYGRPRGLVLPWGDDFFLAAGRIAARFICRERPLAYADEPTEETFAATADVVNEGNHWVWPEVTLESPGSTVVISNDDDGSKAIVLSDLSGTTQVDFRTRSVTGPGGVNLFNSVQAPRQWWRLLPGSNTLNVTGATATVAFRSGWVQA